MSKKIKLFAMALLSLTVILQSFAGSKVVKAASYTPGTYSATEIGFGGDVTVTITVDETSITDVVIDAPSETPEIGGAAAEELAEAIKANGVSIDGVSGATFTSEAVLAAAADAITQAGGEVAIAEEETEEAVEEVAEEEAPEEKKVTFKSLIIIFISAILINNVVLSQFLGICPFLGVSKKVETAAGMGAAVIFVITIASMCTFGIQKLVLDKLGLQYMQTIVFILVIAALVQFVEMVLKKLVPSLYKALGVYLPLITTNCAVLGVSINNITYGHTFLESIFYSVGISTGFALAIVIMAGIRERNEDNDVPNAFKGSPIVLITACLMAIAFTGFAGLL